MELSDIATDQTQALITKLSHDGRGIAHINGKTTFVFGALPGEEVLLSYHKKHSKFDEASVKTRLTSAPEREAPHCEFFGLCGGCSLQHMSQTAQVAFKQDVLLEQLKHFGKVVPEEILPALITEPYGYRRKARYSVRFVRKKQKMLLGFRELFHPRFLAEINTCHVVHRSLAELIAPLQELLSSFENKEHIAQIEAAVGDNATALVIRHLESMPALDQEKLITFAKTSNIWLFLQPKGYDSIHKIWPLDNDDQLTYNLVDGITLYFHPTDFTQVNAGINRQMISQAIKLLDPKPNDVILDLFCGLGNFSLPLAKKGAQVIGIEGDQRMTARAATNASRNQLDTATFSCADLNNVDKMATLPKANKLLIDPPRSGARAVVENLPLDGLETIVYVSCNPATLARDAGILAERGFVLSKVGVMDMFTHTEHVEAMAVFRPAKP
jgi:23S rRNA (uracil1939-C5)-methyltransferase